MKQKNAFTLLETVIAMAVLAPALILLANSWSAAFLRVRKAQLSFEISSLIERKMSEIERKYRGKPIDEISDEEGDFGDEYPQYGYKIAAKKLEFPDVASSLTSRSGGADQMMLTVIHQMTDQISKSVKEVKLTIIYKAQKKKNMEFSVTTYFVDYDKPMALGAPGP